jgi:paraquat-inducible protein B
MPDRPHPDTSSIPEAVAVPKRHWTLPLVWIIPTVAALLGAWLALHYLLSQGPTITITFKNAESLEVGKTKVRYKDVDIGTVSEIHIAEDRSHVVVTAQLAKQAESLIMDDTRFWVERPRITLGSITGLGTIFSGAYIAVDAGKSQKTRKHFIGLDIPPPVTSDARGRQFVLHAESIDSLYLGAPVYLRRVQVGKITGYKINEDGEGVTLDIFINAPNDRFVTANTRFWHASGIDLSLDSNGIKLNTESLISIIIGGIAFQTPPDTPEMQTDTPAPENMGFTLYADKASALRRSSREAQSYVLYFAESLRGLVPGASVDFHGIVIGEVKAIGVDYGHDGHEADAIRFPVGITLFPERLRSHDHAGAPSLSPLERNPRMFLNRLVTRGFRAQLKSANLLTGQLFIALDFFPSAPPAGIDWTKTPVVLPTVPQALADIQETLSNIARKLDRVPLDAIGRDLDRTLKTLDSTLRSADQAIKQLDATIIPELKAALGQAKEAIASTESVLSADAPMQQDLHDTLVDVSRAAQAIRELADYLSRHPEALIRGKR